MRRDAMRCDAMRCDAMQCGACDACGVVQYTRCVRVRCVRCARTMRAVRCSAILCMRCDTRVQCVRCGGVGCGTVQCGGCGVGVGRGAARCGAVRCGARCGAGHAHARTYGILFVHMDTHIHRAWGSAYPAAAQSSAMLGEGTSGHLCAHMQSHAHADEPGHAHAIQSESTVVTNSMTGASVHVDKCMGVGVAPRGGGPASRGVLRGLMDPHLSTATERFATRFSLRVPSRGPDFGTSLRVLIAGGSHIAPRPAHPLALATEATMVLVESFTS